MSLSRAQLKAQAIEGGLSTSTLLSPSSNKNLQPFLAKRAQRYLFFSCLGVAITGTGFYLMRPDNSSGAASSSIPFGDDKEAVEDERRDGAVEKGREKEGGRPQTNNNDAERDVHKASTIKINAPQQQKHRPPRIVSDDEAAAGDEAASVAAQAKKLSAQKDNSDVANAVVDEAADAGADAAFTTTVGDYWLTEGICQLSDTHLSSDSIIVVASSTTDTTPRTRPSFGTQTPLPPVMFEETNSEGRLPLASICLSKEHPMHVALVLGGGGGGSSSATTTLPLDLQLNQLTSIAPDYLVGNVVVTVMADRLTHRRGGVAIDGASSHKNKRIVDFGVVHFDSHNSSILLTRGEAVVPTNAASLWPYVSRDIRKSLESAQTARKNALVNSVNNNNNIEDALDAPPPAAAAGNSKNKIARKDRLLTSLHAALGVMSVSAAAGGSNPAAPKPHFVFSLPHDTVFTSYNIRGLCYVDTVINDESEATSYYPYADPFVPKDRKFQHNGRLTVGFLRAATSGSSSGAHDDAFFGSSEATKHVTLISSCRPPQLLSSATDADRLVIDSKHYSKGGDMVSRGALWCLDVGSAMEKNSDKRGGASAASSSSVALSSAAVTKPRTVIVPYFAGVHTDVLLGVPLETPNRVAENGDAAVADTDISSAAKTSELLSPSLNNGQRLNVFPLKRKVIDGYCSADPNDPVRVSTFMNGYVNMSGIHKPRNGFDISIRTINATALMTGYSDLMIATNANGEDLMKLYRADVRKLPAATFINTSKSIPDNFGEFFLDKVYPNTHGELVITTFHKQARGTWRVISGDTIYRMVSHLGFYDIVRYSEEDVYMSRDQFEHYCAMLPHLEEREEFLDYLRFEAFWEYIDESYKKGDPIVPHDKYQWKRIAVDVLQRRLPYREQINFMDQVVGYPWGFREGKLPFSVQLQKRRPERPQIGSGSFSTFNSVATKDPTRNTVPFPIPIAPQLYDMVEVPLAQCRFVGKDKSTHLTQNTAADVSGCYTYVHSYSYLWRMNRIYPAQWILPTHRLQHWFLEGSKSNLNDKARTTTQKNADGTPLDVFSLPSKSSIWRGYDKPFSLLSQRYAYNWDPNGPMYGEFIAYFGSPMQTYDQGGIYAVFMEEDEGLDAFKNREPGGEDYGKKNQTYHGLHRLTTVNHGRNGNIYDKPPAEAFMYPRVKVPGV